MSRALLRIRSALLSGAIATIATIAVAQPSVAQQSAAPMPGGSGTIYVGTYANTILVVDEASLTVVDTIPIASGIPTQMVLSQDRTRFYVLEPRFEQVEVIDIATRRSVDRFTLTSGNTRVRIWGFNVDPRHRFAVLLVKTYTKKLDRYEVSKPMLLRYDLASKTVTDTIPWPKDEERDGAQIIFSPDGALLYFFTTDDVLVYETEGMKEVDRWQLSRTLFEEGIGRLNFFFPNDIYEEPGFYTGLFRITDPVNRRQLMGVARVDLVNRALDFYTLGPSQPVGFSLAPGRTRAYGLQQQVGNYQFWTFDLESRRVASRTPFAGRPRMGLTPSSDGRFIYIHTAGHTIDVYDADTFDHLRTVELNADMTRFVLIPPRPAAPGGESASPDAPHASSTPTPRR
ncbi:MAG TPA: hypothetical protein VMM18_05325 [Gemmatimonadaceae bacterium]|nr:hypothetical protein [Gemmatimonadaceae bacterium]